MTPEGYVKRELKKILAGRCDHRWPVTRGMGLPMLDCHAVVDGTAWVIECKAPGEEPTARQVETMTELWRAGACVSLFEYNGVACDEDAHRARCVLKALEGGEYAKARMICREWLQRKTFNGKPINLEAR